MVDKFKRSDVVGTSIGRGSADNMVMNTTLDVLSAITRGGQNFRGDNFALYILNVFNNFLYAVRVLQGECDVTAMIYSPNISAFIDENNHQTATKFASVLFNTQVKVLKTGSSPRSPLFLHVISFE